MAGFGKDIDDFESTQSWLSPKVQRRNSTLAGDGIFALQKIDKDETIVIFHGTIMTESQVLELSQDHITYVMQVDDNHWLYAQKREDADYFNHSCTPNVGFLDQCTLVAMKDIEPNEEISFDYAMVVTRYIGMDAFVCNCRAKNCRKMIFENDWKNIELQEKYRTYFSPYIQQKIMQNK